MKKKEKRIHSDVVRDSLNTFGTNAFGAVLGLVSSIVVLRRVDPTVKGYYNAVQTWGGGFYTLVGLSIAASIIYFVARFKIENTKKSILKLGAAVFALIAVVGTAVMVLLRNSSFFSKTPSPFLAAIVVYALCSLVLNLCTGVLRGENKFKSFNMINLTQRILATLLALYIAFRPSASYWIWGTVAISAGMIVFALVCIRRWNGPRPKPIPDDDYPVPQGAMLKYSLKAHVSNVLTYINTFLGTYIVQGRYGIKNLGVYSTAFTIMQQVWILPDAVSQVIMSRIAAMSEQKDKLHLTLISTKVVTYVTAVAALLILWLANIFVPWLFPMYKGALAPLAYLIVGSIFISYAKVLGNSISAYGRPELNIIPTVLGVVSNCISCLLVIPLMGINGVALSTSISLTVQGLSSVAIFCAYSHTPLYRLFVPTREELRSVKNVFKK
ncbi:MAG: oligosaccharide flippase family protein [Oscillospiraceae bacterium]|nr:oligosaccharide flippase family protein [Oscillospiraceae bacterium]MDD3261166.1 oligosaccharide flippase family protein [Oscillospiraceae bacterium]